jgi:hypothetical protein
MSSVFMGLVSELLLCMTVSGAIGTAPLGKNVA